MVEEKITLDREAFKALAADTRVDILKRLDEHKLTLTDLACAMDMRPSTIKEHLDKLVAAGLIYQDDKGMKWKYYKLTTKGRSVLHPLEAKIWILLGVTLLALGGSFIRLFNSLQDYAVFRMPVRATTESLKALPMPETALSRGAPAAADSVAFTAAPNAVEETATTVGDLAGTAEPEGFLQEAKMAAEYAADEAEPVMRALGETASNATEPISTTLSSTIETTTSLVGQAVRESFAEPATSIASATPDVITYTIPVPWGEIIVTVALVLVAGLCIGYLLRKRSMF